jgi:hypothetical protein
MNAWGKHPLRSAQLWADSILKCRSDAHLFIQDYYEIKYEFLLQRPKLELEQVSDFLGLEFEHAMRSLGKPVENLGDTQTASYIVRSNIEKWRNGFSDRVVKKIEEITFDLLQALEYPVIYAKRQTRLTSTRLFLLKGIDAWNRLNFDCRHNGGLHNGLLYQYRKRRFG